MKYKLSGTIKNYECDYEDRVFRALTYISPDEDNFQFVDTFWLNLSTGKRNIDRNKGMCIWCYQGSDIFKYGFCHGESVREICLSLVDDFREATKGTFFHSSNYNDIVKPFKNVPFDNYLFVGPDQREYHKNRLPYLLPGLADSGCEYRELDQVMAVPGVGQTFQAIAIVKDIPKGHICPLFLNLDSGDFQTGHHPWTLLLKAGISSDIRDMLEEKNGIMHFAKTYHLLWNNYILNDYMDDYMRTIGSQAIGWFDRYMEFNHHLVITDDQVPDDWIKEDGRWRGRRKGGSTQEGWLTPGMVEIFFS